MYNLGDVNGDHFDDLFVGPGNSADSLVFIYYGGPTFDTLPDVIITDWPEKANSAGDINRDGYADLIIGAPLPGPASYVYVYYGGPNMDSLADIKIWGDDLPFWTENFGAAVAGVGDVNGDGVDDFAAGARDANGYGRIFVFSGTGTPNDVLLERDPTVPRTFSLGQNYPNPTNPGTVIPFDLPTRSLAELSIYNVEGKLVKVLIDRELSAGSYRVTWNGRNQLGAPVASGVYLYRLRSGGSILSKKMLLLK